MLVELIEFRTRKGYLIKHCREPRQAAALGAAIGVRRREERHRDAPSELGAALPGGRTGASSAPGPRNGCGARVRRRPPFREPRSQGGGARPARVLLPLDLRAAKFLPTSAAVRPGPFRKPGSSTAPQGMIPHLIGRPHVNLAARRRAGAWRLSASPDAANPLRSARFRVDYATIRERDPPADAFKRSSMSLTRRAWQS